MYKLFLQHQLNVQNYTKDRQQHNSPKREYFKKSPSNPFHCITFENMYLTHQLSAAFNPIWQLEKVRSYLWTGFNNRSIRISARRTVERNNC